MTHFLNKSLFKENLPRENHSSLRLTDMNGVLSTVIIVHMNRVSLLLRCCWTIFFCWSAQAYGNVDVYNILKSYVTVVFQVYSDTYRQLLYKTRLRHCLCYDGRLTINHFDYDFKLGKYCCFLVELSSASLYPLRQDHERFQT